MSILIGLEFAGSGLRVFACVCNFLLYDSLGCAVFVDGCKKCKPCLCIYLGRWTFVWIVTSEYILYYMNVHYILFEYFMKVLLKISK